MYVVVVVVVVRFLEVLCLFEEWSKMIDLLFLIWIELIWYCAYEILGALFVWFAWFFLCWWFVVLVMRGVCCCLWYEVIEGAIEGGVDCI